MPLIVMPGQLATRSEFYHQLSQLTAAGFGLVASLEQLKRNPPARSYREPIRKLLENLSSGFTFAESLERLGLWLPAFDVALLQAGEHSGRLDACFKLMADLAYPVALFHFAIFILPFAQFFMSGNWLKYLAQTVGVLIPIYAIIGLVVYAAQ